MIGVMNGRLSPAVENQIQCFPFHAWRSEFQAARDCGLECIEWIYELPHLEDNPLSTAQGLDEMRRLMDATGVAVPSIVADNFMFERLFGPDRAEAETSLDRLLFLLDQAACLGARIVEVPLLSRTSVRDPRDRADLAATLAPALARVEKLGLILAFEVDLAPDQVLDLLERLDCPRTGITYDMGNSTQNRLDPAQELAAYGRRLVNVHIKDGLPGGGTVPLGTGRTDFAAVFAGLRAADYQGDYILQAARQDLNGQARPIAETMREYREFALRCISGQAPGPGRPL